jgi:hypothetical protein
MHIPDSANCSYVDNSKGDNIYKVIIAKAIPDRKSPTASSEILLFTKYTQAIAEVWIDQNSGKITSVLFPDSKRRYENIPVPVF